MNPETYQKWVEWLSRYRPLGLLVVFKGDELLLKSSWHVSIDIYGKVTYTLYRPEFKGIMSPLAERLNNYVPLVWLKVPSQLMTFILTKNVPNTRWLNNPPVSPHPLQCILHH